MLLAPDDDVQPRNNNSIQQKEPAANAGFCLIRIFTE